MTAQVFYSLTMHLSSFDRQNEAKFNKILKLSGKLLRNFAKCTKTFTKVNEDFVVASGVLARFIKYWAESPLAKLAPKELTEEIYESQKIDS